MAFKYFSKRRSADTCKLASCILESRTSLTVEDVSIDAHLALAGDASRHTKLRHAMLRFAATELERLGRSGYKRQFTRESKPLVCNGCCAKVRVSRACSRAL